MENQKEIWLDTSKPYFIYPSHSKYLDTTRPVLLIDHEGIIFAPHYPQKALLLPWKAIERIELVSPIQLLLREDWINLNKAKLLDQCFIQGMAQDVYHELHDTWLILDHDHLYSIQPAQLFEILKTYKTQAD